MILELLQARLRFQNRGKGCNAVRANGVVAQTEGRGVGVRGVQHMYGIGDAM